MFFISETNDVSISVWADLSRVWTLQVRSNHSQPGPVPEAIQRGAVLGCHGDAAGSKRQQASPAAPEVHQARVPVRPFRIHFSFDRKETVYLNKHWEI